jgi:hypothetical protein
MLPPATTMQTLPHVPTEAKGSGCGTIPSRLPEHVCYRCGRPLRRQGTCPPCAMLAQLTHDTPRQLRVCFALGFDDATGRHLLLSRGAVFDRDLSLWTAAPPATELRLRLGCVPNPLRAHLVLPAERGGPAMSIHALMQGKETPRLTSTTSGA